MITVRFRPVTILIGRNSSGKSTIIKFLLMLQQTAAPGRSRFINPEGSKVGLGTFLGLKNTLTSKRQLRFELAAELSEGEAGALPIVRKSAHGRYGTDEIEYRVDARLDYVRTATKGKVQYSITQKSSSAPIDKLEAVASDDSTIWDVSAADTAPPLPRGVPRDNSTFDPQTLDPDEVQEFQTWMFRYMRRQDIVHMLRHHIDGVRHLLPVRAEAQRVIIASPPPADDVGQNGAYTLPHLQQITDTRADAYQFMLPHLANIAGIESVQFRTSSRSVSQAYARNKVTGADVLIADYGFGVGQCLPILVQGAIMAPYSVLMVEQPEAQLHPTAQLELGGFFADLWIQRRVASIIETHSGNILLRVRRLIASKKLLPEDVSVAFFTFDESRDHMPTVKNLDINADGSMAPGLPMEFFGADIFEAMDMGAGL